MFLKKPYHDIIALQKAHTFLINVYKHTISFPKEEIYGLTSQLRRAALSVPANIVEGSARSSRKEFVRFLNISESSLLECEYYLEVARELGYLTDEGFTALEASRKEAGALLHNLKKSLVSN